MSARGRRGIGWAGICVGFVGLAACGGGPGGGADAVGAKRPHYEGRMRLGDTWLEVTPVVINEAKMDLATLCQILRDEETKAGKADPVLCYGPERRPAGTVKTLRIELRKGSFGEVMKALADKHEGAHVVADKTGTLYQILDFALPARRDGSVREDEVRLVALEDRGRTALDALVEELKPVFPGVQVDVVPIAATGVPAEDTKGSAP